MSFTQYLEFILNYRRQLISLEVLRAKFEELSKNNELVEGQTYWLVEAGHGHILWTGDTGAGEVLVFTTEKDAIKYAMTLGYSQFGYFPTSFVYEDE